MGHRLGRVSTLHATRNRFARGAVESLEDRMAPGCLLDCFGLATGEFSLSHPDSAESHGLVAGGPVLAATSHRGLQPPKAVLTAASTIEQVVSSTCKTNRQRPDTNDDSLDQGAIRARAIGEALRSNLQRLGQESFTPEFVLSM